MNQEKKPLLIQSETNPLFFLFPVLILANLIFGADKEIAVLRTAENDKTIATDQYLTSRHEETVDPASIRHPFAKGDAVRIVIAPDTMHFVNGIYHIDDHGYVFLPVIGSTRVDTMSEKTLTTFLNTVYLQYLRYPTVQVQPLIRLSLLGGFYKPGLYYINPQASVWEAIALAGGPVREDGLKKINWYREDVKLKSGLVPFVSSGVSLETMGVKSGDHFRVMQQPMRTGWEVFIADVLPIVSVTVSALSTTATLYYVAQASKGVK